MWILGFILQASNVTTITLAEGQQVHAVKLQLGQPASEDGAFLTARDFLRVKTAVERNRARCEGAIHASIHTCIDGLKRDRGLVGAEIQTLKETADVLAASLKHERLRAKQATHARRLWFWVAMSALSTTAALTVWQVLQ